MRVLLDTCVPRMVFVELERAGHDVDWTANWPEDPGDDEILNRAHAEQRVLITLDKDFGEMAIHFGRPHSGIVRLAQLSAAEQAQLCPQILTRYGDELLSGAIVTAEPGRLRIRPHETD